VFPPGRRPVDCAIRARGALGTDCGAEDLPTGIRSIRLGVSTRIRCQSLAQQKTPRRGGEAFLGLLQGGEICISIYVDRWEVGGPFMCRGDARWESSAIWAARSPARKFCKSPNRPLVANP
jgi:hypothetical protein